MTIYYTISRLLLLVLALALALAPAGVRGQMGIECNVEGGVCMVGPCGASIQHPTNDCPFGETCCFADDCNGYDSGELNRFECIDAAIGCGCAGAVEYTRPDQVCAPGGTVCCHFDLPNRCEQSNLGGYCTDGSCLSAGDVLDDAQFGDYWCGGGSAGPRCCAVATGTDACCDDGNACTSTDFDGVTGACTVAPMDCDDGTVCTADTCNGGACINTPIDCDDGDACTYNFCDSVTGCNNPPMDCDDGTVCTADTCSGGACINTPIDCDDGDACTHNFCDSVTGCHNPPVDCDDGTVCTTDTCSGGACRNTPIDCDDGDVCTYNFCDSVLGCNNPPNPTVCDDGDACTVDSCGASGCLNEPVLVDDGDPCTVDSCNPSTGLVTHAPVSLEDGDPCTYGRCDPFTGHVYHLTVLCDDDAPCTHDACNPVTGACEWSAPSTCLEPEFCSQGACILATTADVPVTGVLDTMSTYDGSYGTQAVITASGELGVVVTDEQLDSTAIFVMEAPEDLAITGDVLVISVDLSLEIPDPLVLDASVSSDPSYMTTDGAESALVAGACLEDSFSFADAVGGVLYVDTCTNTDTSDFGTIATGEPVELGCIPDYKCDTTCITVNLCESYTPWPDCTCTYAADKKRSLAQNVTVVTGLAMRFRGANAVLLSNMTFTVFNVAPPPPVGPGCVRGQGYVKHHLAEMSSEMLCGLTVTERFATKPKKGNAIPHLMHQLGVVEYNVQVGGAVLSAPLQAAYDEGIRLLLENCEGVYPRDDNPSRRDIILTAVLLRRFSRGKEGTPPCTNKARSYTLTAGGRTHSRRALSTAAEDAELAEEDAALDAMAKTVDYKPSIYDRFYTEDPRTAVPTDTLNGGGIASAVAVVAVFVAVCVGVIVKMALSVRGSSDAYAPGKSDDAFMVAAPSARDEERVPLTDDNNIELSEHTVPELFSDTV